MNPNNNQTPSINNNQIPVPPSQGQVPQNNVNTNPSVVTTQNNMVTNQTPVAPANVATPVTPATSVTPTPVSPATPTPITPVTPTIPNASAQVPPTTPGTGYVASTHTPTDPNGMVEPVNIIGGMPVVEDKDVSVINTTKHKTSYLGLAIVIGLLIFFVLNMDTMVAYYEKFYNEYVKSGSLTDNNNSSDNLSDGYILIGETTSSKKENNLLFNNFQKSSDTSLIFNYTAFENKTNVASLNMYICVYDANKNLLYKELFDPQKDIESNTTTQYSIKLSDSIYNSASYIKISNNSVDNEVLTCSKSDNNYNYKNTYNFNNEMLVSFEVSKESLNVHNDIENEYNQIKDAKNATLENNILKYIVDFDTVISEDYQKGQSKYFVKSNEEAKEWKCE